MTTDVTRVTRLPDGGAVLAGLADRFEALTVTLTALLATHLGPAESGAEQIMQGLVGLACAVVGVLLWRWGSRG